MYGFKKQGAKQAQNLADGGVVDSVVNGAKRLAYLVSLGHGKPKSPEPQQSAPQAPAPEPKPEGVKAITGYTGMDAMRRREAAAGLKDGGPVRGPGTGTSDSIKTEAAEGSYIMPADSTATIGEQELGGLGFKSDKVPVNLSNGEYELPPEQVHAVGVQALDQMKNATHTPAAMQGEASTKHDELFFADGGAVGGFLPRMRSSGSGWRTESVLAGTGQDIEEQARNGNYGQAAGTLVRGTLAAVPAAAADVGQDLIDNPITRGAVGFGKGLFGISDQQQGAATADPAGAKPAAAPVSAAAQAAKPAPAASAPAAAAAPVSPSAAPSQPSAPLANNVTREGNSYSGQNIGAGFTINGREPAGGTVNVLPTGGAQPRAATPAPVADPAAGFRPSFMGISAPSSNADRSAVLNSALTQIPGARGITANQLRVAQGIVEGDQRDATTRYTADQQASTQRDLAAMREAGDTGRAALRESGDSTRAAASNAVLRGELDLRREAQGFKSRELQRQESLYAKYDAAKTPEERSAIAQQIRDLSGRETPNRFTVVQGGQEIDPLTQQLVTRPGRVFNNQSGQFVDQQPSSGPAAPKAGEVRNGYRFKGGNPADQKSWEKA